MSNQEELLEQWKTELFQDQALNKLFDRDLSQSEFVFLILKNYNMVQLGDIFSKLTSINQSISLQLDHHIKCNYETLINDLKDQSSIGDIDSVQLHLDKIKILQNRLRDSFISKYQRIEKQQPILNNSQQALILCKAIQKYSQQLKLLKTVAQPTQNSINIIDPLRVAHILFEINKLIPTVNKFNYYIQSAKYIQLAEEAVLQKASRKFQDALTNKSLPELTQCLAIYYSLNKLPQILEYKINTVLKQISESYKILLSKEQNNCITDLRGQVKDDFNYSLQIWLIWQATQQRDPQQLIQYDECLQDSLPNVFHQYWEKYCDILEQSYTIIISNKNRYENTYKQIISSYPQIVDLYQEFMIIFQEQVLVFPSSILLNVRISDYSTGLQASLKPIEQLYRLQFQQSAQAVINNVIQDLIEPGIKGVQYFERVIQSLSRYVDLIRDDIIPIKQDQLSYKYATSRIISEIHQRLVELDSTQNNEFMVAATFIMWKLINSISDHPLNHHIDIAQLEQLVLTISKIPTKQYDLVPLNNLFDTYMQCDAKLRKQPLDQLVNLLLGC